MANEQNLKPFNKGYDARRGSKPKGTVHISTHIQRLLNDPSFKAWVYDAKEGVKEFKGAPLKAIIKAQAIKAINGDTKAYDSLVKYGWSQKTETDITSDGARIGLTPEQATQLLKLRALEREDGTT